jgi:hypothetical protein
MGQAGCLDLLRPATPHIFFLNFFISINASFFIFLKNLIIFILIPIFSSILFRESILNDDDLFVMRLIFEEIFLIHL